MEKKYKRIPFDLELAKAITKGEKEGRVVMRNNKPIRLISFSIDDRFCPILGITDNWDGTNTACQFTIDGGFLVTKQTNENDLFLEVPKEQALKEGDVVMYSKFQVAIYNKDLQRVFAWTTLKGEKPRYDDTFFTPPVRLATPEEKQLLIDALKKDNSEKAREYLKRFFGIEVEHKFTLNQEVLVRDVMSEWRHAHYSHFSKRYNQHVADAMPWQKCIPYNEQTKHLLGTTDDWEG